MPPLAYAEPREYFSADARLADGGWMLNLKRKGQVTWPGVGTALGTAWRVLN
jgi:hypothetical protein